MAPNHRTNGATTTSPDNGSTEPPIDIVTEFPHHDHGSTNTPTNGSNTTPINGSTKPRIDIATGFSHHDPAYTNGSITIPSNGSTSTQIKGSTKPQTDIAIEFSHHDSAYTNGSTGSPTTPLDIATEFALQDPTFIRLNTTTTPLDIATEFSHHDPTSTCLNNTTTSLDIATKLSHQDPTFTRLNTTTTPLDIATKLSHQDPTFTGLNKTTTPLDVASEFTHHDPTFTHLNTTTTPLDIACKLSQHDPSFTRLNTTTTLLDIATKLSDPDPTLPRHNTTTTPLDIATEFAHHDPAYVRLNNGSFGCCPSSILSAQKKWHQKFLENPDLFYFNTLQPSLLKSRHAIKTLINADSVDEVSILDNVTTAAAIILRHTAWSFFSGDLLPGDSVLILQKAYGAVKKSVGAYVSRAGGNVIEVPIPFPIDSNEQIISEFKKALELGKSNGVQTIKLAIIDHVTSFPSILIPVKQLVKLCKDEGVDKVFVDGAHGIGCVDVDVKEIGADYYASSLYKWFFCPPAAAFLYCKSSVGSVHLHHPIVSHEYGKGLPAESGWIGTRDYSVFCLIPEVVEYVSNKFEGGIGGVMLRNHERVVEMAEMLAKAWGTGLGSPPEMCASMVMVGLPSCLGISSDGDGWDLMERLRTCFRILAPVYYREPLEGDGVGVVTGYARISHQVYNKVEDYFRLRDAINKLVDDGFTYKANKGCDLRS